MDEFDEQLFQEVMDAIENRLMVTGLEISGSDGSITLSGIVPTEEARGAAERIARGVQGVRYVKNELRVRSGTSTGQTEKLLRNIKEVLASDPAAAREDITVSVEEDAIVIEGTVPDIQKKNHIASLIKEVQGMQGFSFRVAVVPRRSMSDEILAYNVLRELTRHKRVYINSIDIIVENGIVTLSGRVPSYMIKTTVYETALMTPGVSEVRDKMEVEAPF